MYNMYVPFARAGNKLNNRLFTVWVNIPGMIPWTKGSFRPHSCTVRSGGAGVQAFSYEPV